MTRFLATSVVLLALAATACGEDDTDDDAAKKPKTLEVGLSFSPGVDDTADRVAFAELKRKSGIRVKFTETGGPPNTAAGLLRNDFDMGSTSLLSAVNAIDQGADLEVILGAAMAVDFFLVGGKGVGDIADLEARRVASGEPGGASEVVTKVALERAGVNAKLSVLDDSGARAAALTSGRIDAAALEFPDLELVSAKEAGLTPVASLHEIAPFLMADVWIVRKDFAEKNRELLEDVVGGLLDGYEFVRSEAGRKAWLAEAKPHAGGKEGEAVLDAIYDRSKEIRYWPRRDEPVSEERHDQSVRFWRDAGLVESHVPFDEVWDTSFWQAAG
jgi:ABC-type nitrate/sulfonate/bicarbonate transport system substrate-binding protein